MFLLVSLLYSYCISSVSIMKMYSNILKFILVAFFLLSVRKVFTIKSKIRTFMILNLDIIYFAAEENSMLTMK